MWMFIIGLVVGCIGGYALTALAISRGYNFGNRKGHGLDMPWWFTPVAILIYPLVLLDKLINKIPSVNKGERDPHDISGE